MDAAREKNRFIERCVLGRFECEWMRSLSAFFGVCAEWLL